MAFGLAAAMGAAVSATPPTFYTIGDFTAVEKIDAHVHIHGPADRFMEQTTRDNFRLLTINVDYPDFPPIPEQQRDAVSLRERHPGRVAFAGAFSASGFGSPGWLEATQRQIDSALAQGAVGFKIWKNIGMAVRNPDGSYVMPDDERLEPVIARFEREHIVLLGHQAEPLNCWLPLNEMTVKSDRDYFTEHPQYYMYKHPEMPSHDRILAARDRMLAAHPKLVFDSVHLASLEWDVNKVAEFLDRFPNARVDLAARLVHLEYHAAKNPAKVRRFLVKYQDRVLYGSDDAYGPEDSDPKALESVHSGWVDDWRFLVTFDEMHSSDFDQPFHGLHLPKAVVDKIYRSNAKALFSRAWSTPPAR
jgi:predicted TIM-barrel fold metal-dependent hydrolase